MVIKLIDEPRRIEAYWAGGWDILCIPMTDDEILRFEANAQEEEEETDA